MIHYKTMNFKKQIQLRVLIIQYRRNWHRCRSYITIIKGILILIISIKTFDSYINKPQTTIHFFLTVKLY